MKFDEYFCKLIDLEKGQFVIIFIKGWRGKEKVMKKLSKSTYILVPIIIVILISFIGMYNYRKPITIHKIFNEAIVMEKGSKVVLKKTTIEINAKLNRGLYRGSILDFNARFVNQLEGKIVIDNNEYSFYGGTGIRLNLNKGRWPLTTSYPHSNKESEIHLPFRLLKV